MAAAGWGSEKRLSEVDGGRGGKSSGEFIDCAAKQAASTFVLGKVINVCFSSVDGCAMKYQR